MSGCEAKAHSDNCNTSTGTPPDQVALHVWFRTLLKIGKLKSTKVQVFFFLPEEYEG